MNSEEVPGQPVLANLKQGPVTSDLCYQTK